MQHIIHYQGPLNLPIKWKVTYYILLTFLKKIQEIKHLKKAVIPWFFIKDHSQHQFPVKLPFKVIITTNILILSKITEKKWNTYI